MSIGLSLLSLRRLILVGGMAKWITIRRMLRLW